MSRKIIVATDRNGGIGKDNDLLWHLPADMQFFKSKTSGHIVIMGRKNYESIPEKFRPLPNRTNIVLTRNPDYEAPGCAVFHSLEACMESLAQEKLRKDIYIIGGGEIYRKALQLGVVDEMYITHVDHVFDADTFFPETDPEEWTSEEILRHPADEKNPYPFTIRYYTHKH